MEIVGHGIDIVSVERIGRMLADHGERFLVRCFTAKEQAAGKGRVRAAEHFAARFAAKEAFLKALGMGLTGGLSWTDIEVVSLPTGQPTLALHGPAMLAARTRQVDRTYLSLSHTDGMAVASVIAVKSRRPSVD